jgi:hypothetical protein
MRQMRHFWRCLASCAGGPRPGTRAEFGSYVRQHHETRMRQMRHAGKAFRLPGDLGNDSGRSSARGSDLAKVGFRGAKGDPGDLGNDSGRSSARVSDPARVGFRSAEARPFADRANPDNRWRLAESAFAPRKHVLSRSERRPCLGSAGSLTPPWARPKVSKASAPARETFGRQIGGVGDPRRARYAKSAGSETRAERGTHIRLPVYLSFVERARRPGRRRPAPNRRRWFGNTLKGETRHKWEGRK